MRAARNNVSSENGAPSNCNPMGSFWLLKPAGIEIPGIPARFALIV